MFPSWRYNNIENALEDKDGLIRELYEKQSGGEDDPESIRFHYENRLFVVCYDSSEQHNHLSVKADVVLTENAIDEFMRQYTPENAKRLDVTKPNGEVVNLASDIIFVIR